MTMTDDRPLVEQLNERLTALSGEMRELMTTRQAERAAATEARGALADDEARTAHDTEQEEAEARYATAYAALEREYKELRDERGRQTDQAEREADATRAGASAGTGITRQRDPLTYREDNAIERSFFKDLAIAHSQARDYMQPADVQECRERIIRHQSEMRGIREERQADREREARRQIEEAMDSEREKFKRRGLLSRSHGEPMFNRDPSGYAAPPSMGGTEQRVNPNTTQGQGGYFDPPEWLVQDWIPYLRAGRTTANLCRQLPVPPGYQSVNIPKVSTPTLVANQGANNVAVVSQDIADTAISTGFKTYAGQEDVSIQWLDMSPGHIADTVVTSDLTFAYNLAVGTAVVSGTGSANSTTTSGQLCGLWPTTAWGGTSVTCTIGSPTIASMYPTFGAQLSQISQKRFDVSSAAFALHPRRGYWAGFSLDGSSARPFMESSGFAPWNPGGIINERVAEGEFLTLPSGHRAYIDANIPTTDNSNATGGTYDISLCANWDDVWLFEDAPRVRVLQEVLSGTLQVRFQIFNYLGLIVRYGGAYAIANGSGFAAPTANGGSF